jgi:hypothetical protein
MKSFNLVSAVLILFLLGGCLTAHKNKNDKNKNIETYRLDLDYDKAEELVEIEDRFAAHGDMAIRITKFAKNKKAEPKIFNFTITGQLNKVEFSELGCDGLKQMLIYYDTAKNFTHLVIYKFKNDKVSQIFLASSNCDIETDFDTVPRVKIAKNIEGGRDCSVVTQGSDWEVLAWDGEKFVKEH